MWLPAAERRGEIHFHLGKSLPYGIRLVLAFGLVMVGLALQSILYGLGLPGLVPGLALVFAGVVLLLPKGYENRPATGRPSAAWRSARREEVARIIEVNRKQQAWDRDAVDITSGIGLVTLIGVVAVLWATVGTIAGISETAAVFVAANAAAMLLPFWLTGVRSILKNDKLVVKTETLMKMEDAFKAARPQEGEEFQYQMQTADTRSGEGAVPRDLKALVAFHKGSPDFLGLQMQIAINSVQGKDYPYFYCVLVAKTAFGGLRAPRSLPDNVVAEPKREDDVDVLVIRQRTTKNSGYHTKTADAVRIFNLALNAARAHLES